MCIESRAFQLITVPFTATFPMPSPSLVPWTWCLVKLTVKEPGQYSPAPCVHCESFKESMSLARRLGFVPCIINHLLYKTNGQIAFASLAYTNAASLAHSNDGDAATRTLMSSIISRTCWVNVVPSRILRAHERCFVVGSRGMPNPSPSSPLSSRLYMLGGS